MEEPRPPRAPKSGDTLDISATEPLTWEYIEYYSWGFKKAETYLRFDAQLRFHEEAIDHGRTLRTVRVWLKAGYAKELFASHNLDSPRWKETGKAPLVDRQQTMTGCDTPEAHEIKLENGRGWRVINRPYSYMLWGENNTKFPEFGVVGPNPDDDMYQGRFWLDPKEWKKLVDLKDPYLEKVMCEKLSQKHLK